MIIKTGIISKIAITIFNINIYWYAILIALAVVIGLIICKIRDGKFGIDYQNILDLCLIMLPVAIIFARVYYVIFMLDNYITNPIQIINFRDGGLAIYGGIIGGAITTIIFCKIKKIKILDVLDYLSPCLALGQSIGRWGNYINIEAYGKETSFFIKMQIIEDGVIKYVHPTFLYECIVTLVLFVILLFISKKRKFSGQITYLYIIIYSFARIFIEYLRTDSLMLYNYKISLILSVFLFVFFSCIFVNKICKHNKK